MFDTVILADDLSGAADCAVACVQKGLRTLVTLGEPSSSAVADVISIDADTRRLDPASAASRMQSLTMAFAADPSTLLFKKVDSSLRGHLGPELASVLQARRTGGGPTVAVMAPALPANGRTVRRGSAYVNGRPVHETELWRNQRMDGDGYIPTMLQRAGLSSTHVDLGLVRSTGLSDALRKAESRYDVLLCDSMTDEDLEHIAVASRVLDSGIVWVGSAGLARHLPYFRSPANAASHSAMPLTGTSGPLLFVVGSMCRTAQKQVAVLRSSGDIYSVTVHPDILAAGPDASSWKQVTSELKQAVANRRDVVLSPAPTPVIRVSDRPQLSRSLGAMTTGLRLDVGALVACGGETARMVLDCWGVSMLRLQGELEHGVAVSAPMDTQLDIPIVTKAGDFGTPDTLMNCRKWLHAGKEVYP
jgi:4-hydroxythreonine-4-phosphate dehydrogenase